MIVRYGLVSFCLSNFERFQLLHPPFLHRLREPLGVQLPPDDRPVHGFLRLQHFGSQHTTVWGDLFAKLLVDGQAHGPRSEQRVEKGVGLHRVTVVEITCQEKAQRTHQPIMAHVSYQLLAINRHRLDVIRCCHVLEADYGAHHGYVGRSECRRSPSQRQVCPLDHVEHDGPVVGADALAPDVLYGRCGVGVVPRVRRGTDDRPEYGCTGGRSVRRRVKGDRSIVCRVGGRLPEDGVRERRRAVVHRADNRGSELGVSARETRAVG